MGPKKINKILEIKFGSHLYGTSTPESDLDLKGIYLPEADEILFGDQGRTFTQQRPKQEGERNKKDDIDIEIFSLDRFVELLVDGQTVALDMLFAPQWAYTYQTREAERIMDYIFDNREQFLNKNVNAFVGYARKQASKYGVKGFRVAALKATLDMLNGLGTSNPGFAKLLEFSQAIDDFVVEHYKGDDGHIKYTMCRGPNGEDAKHLEVCGRKIPMHATVKYALEIFEKIYSQYGQRAIQAQNNDGIDWKALSHAVRVNSEAIELLTTHKITFPCPNAELLLAIKLGKMPYSQVEQIIEDGLAALEGASEASTLRAEPNRKFARNFVVDEYRAVVIEDYLRKRISE